MPLVVGTKPAATLFAAWRDDTFAELTGAMLRSKIFPM
jgi:hypothetical protein